MLVIMAWLKILIPVICGTLFSLLSSVFLFFIVVAFLSAMMKLSGLGSLFPDSVFLKKKRSVMLAKKDVVFTFRIESDLDAALRRFSDSRGVSSGYVLRRLLRSYLLGRGFLSEVVSK